MPSTPTLKSPASQAQPWSRTTGLLRCTTGRRSAIWSPSQATRCCSTGRKVTGKAVIPTPPLDGSPLPYTVFDPCIWKKDGVYYSLSAGTITEGPNGKRVAADFVFRSKDLETWEYLHPLTEDDRFTLVGDDGACPYFWPIGDQHMLLFFSHTSGGQYLLGDYDTERDKLIVTSHGLFNFGPSTPSGVHAPSATPDGQGGIIVIFNMNPGYPSEGWDQIMTLPRRLTLAGEDEVRVAPAGDIESLRYDHERIEATELPANEEVVLDGIKGSALELILEVDAKDAPMVELNVLRSPDREEHTRIAFYKDRGFRIQPQSTQSGAMLHGAKPAVQAHSQPRPLDIRESLLTLDTSYASTLPGALSRAPRDCADTARPGRTAFSFGYSSTTAWWRCSRTASSASRRASIPVDGTAQACPCAPRAAPPSCGRWTPGR